MSAAQRRSCEQTEETANDCDHSYRGASAQQSRRGCCLEPPASGAMSWFGLRVSARAAFAGVPPQVLE
jgi:hypothetical protein